MSLPNPTAAPVRADSEIAHFERIDALFRDWALAWAAEEVQFPSLIARTTLEQAEYPDAFPHLLISACRCREPRLAQPALLESGNLEPTEWLLSPAVCYHAYPRWAGSVVDQPRVLTARGRCFRHEHEFIPGRRQVEFEMREIVLCGPPEWIDVRVAESRPRIAALAAELGLTGTWETAEDPFFLPTAKGKALIQRLQETKKEFIVPRPAPLAIASINRHGTFFADRFGISLRSGPAAHTACIAFGLDRWASLINTPQTPMPEPTPISPLPNAWQTTSAGVQAIHARLCQVMPQLGPRLHPGQSFRTAGGDSIDFVELLCALEADYGVRFSEDEIAATTTIGEMLTQVDRRATRQPS